MQMKISFMDLEIWLFGFGKVLEKLWDFFEGGCTNLGLDLFMVLIFILK